MIRSEGVRKHQADGDAGADRVEHVRRGQVVAQPLEVP